MPGGFYISDQESNDIRYLSAIYEYYENNIDEAYNNLSNVTSELSFEIKNKNQVFGYIKLTNQGINLNIIILANSNTLSSYLNQICDLKK